MNIYAFIYWSGIRAHTAHLHCVPAWLHIWQTFRKWSEFLFRLFSWCVTSGDGVQIDRCNLRFWSAIVHYFPKMAWKCIDWRYSKSFGHIHRLCGGTNKRILPSKTCTHTHRLYQLMNSCFFNLYIYRMLQMVRASMPHQKCCVTNMSMTRVKRMNKKKTAIASDRSQLHVKLHLQRTF